MRNTGKLKNSQSRNGLYSVVHGGYTTCFLSKDIIEKTSLSKDIIEKTSWCLPQNKFQRNIPFHKFEDGIDCPENTIYITKQRALNIFLIKHNSYLDNIIKSKSICDDTFKNYKYLRELIKKNKNFKCSE